MIEQTVCKSGRRATLTNTIPFTHGCSLQTGLTLMYARVAGQSLHLPTVNTIAALAALRFADDAQAKTCHCLTWASIKKFGYATDAG